MTELSTIARVTVLGGIFVACGAGGAGNVEGSSDPGGPFSGQGNPGASIYRNPGVFSGSGAPGAGAGNDVNSLIAGVCLRLSAICPNTNADQAACAALLLRRANESAARCTPNLYPAYLTCLLSAAIVCDVNGRAASYSCVEPSISSCGTTGGTTGGTGGTATGGTGGTGTGGTGTGGTGTGGTSTGGTGGTGGSTGGTAGTGGSTTGGAAGTGGGGRGGTGGTGRDGGRG